MSLSTIRRAMSTLRTGKPGLESAAGAGGEEPPQDPDEVVDRALAQVLGTRSPPRLSVDEARAALAVAMIEEGRAALREVAAKGTAGSRSRVQVAGLEAIVK